MEQRACGERLGIGMGEWVSGIFLIFRSHVRAWLRNSQDRAVKTFLRRYS
jgi:hypothetical protein